eukprot:TRINITY_DN11149_c0_g1_i1.p1 TRINITY_DN11149_c0_g1~~TRINITY_DN11149_c0_g1_i1.p1  ORF type:complete len:312 (-),score=75.83 TRINITY_DN11149_c0_g1_i1:167-1045(-)
MDQAARVESYPKEFPKQEQDVMPGKESAMKPAPFFDNPAYKGSEKLKNKVAIITGGDSGIGKSVAVFFAREGADVAIVYLKNHEDAEETKAAVEKEGRRCLTIAGDLTSKSFCEEVVETTVKTYGKLDILVNHAGTQFYQEDIQDISEEQLDKTFKTNVYTYFFMTQAALKHLKQGSCIINTNSVNSFKGNDCLIDYSATKGAGTAFTYSMAQNLAEKGIRVNAVAPGPIWTPFIPGSFPAEKVAEFGKNSLMKRAGQPEECAPAYVFLASDVCSSFLTGQTIHPNGGRWFQ